MSQVQACLCSRHPAPAHLLACLCFSTLHYIVSTQYMPSPNEGTPTQSTHSRSSNDEIAHQTNERASTTQRSIVREAVITPTNPAGPSHQPDPGPEPESVRDYLDRIVTTCRRGERSRIDATKAILETLDKLPGLSADTRDKTFGAYLAELNTVGNRAEGVAFGPNIRGDAQAVEAEGERGDRLPPQEAGFPDQLFQLLSKRPAASDELDDLLSPGTKRPRYNQADMPWHGALAGRKTIDYAFSYSRTCELLELYGEDLPRSKFLVRTAQNAPEGVLSSQWERILKGEPLNLDNFLSSIIRTSIDEDRKARLGTTQLTFSTSEARRKVRTYGDWIAAWRRASRAIAFAFPHRADELEDYFLHIQTEFDSKQISAHKRIILYDIAVRNFVGGGQTTLLTERERFSHLYSAIVVSDGVEFGANSSSRRGGGAQTAGRGQETCNKYNTSTGCPHSPCKYRHKCSKCGQDGHGQQECPNARAQ
jgi:hypothetical protein